MNRENRLWYGTATVALALGLAAGPLAGDGAAATPAAVSRPAAEDSMRGAAPSPRGRRIVVSVEKRMLWLIQGKDTLFSAPVAVGRTVDFTYKGKTYHWETPKGKRRVLKKKTDPVWRPPSWHYYEKASYRGLEVVEMEPGERYELSDGSYLEIRGDQVGRVNTRGQWWAWTPGKEIIFDGKIFIPPFGTAQREVPKALGTHAFYIGDGYLIHGTHEYNRDSIGRYASHGCIRMYNEDVRKLFEMVDVGTAVIII
jgi:lipoprotein-anchoring transpeptidase ErfK/SrfK